MITKSVFIWVITEHFSVSLFAVTIMKYLQLDYEENRIIFKKIMLLLILALVRNSWR